MGLISKDALSSLLPPGIKTHTNKTIVSLLNYVTIKGLNMHEHLDAVIDIRASSAFVFNYHSPNPLNWYFILYGEWWGTY